MNELGTFIAMVVFIVLSFFAGRKYEQMKKN